MIEQIPTAEPIEKERISEDVFESDQVKSVNEILEINNTEDQDLKIIDEYSESNVTKSPSSFSSLKFFGYDIFKNDPTHFNHLLREQLILVI